MNIPTLASAYSQINNLLYKSYLPKIINTAVEIGVFDILSNKDLSFKELSKKMYSVPNITESLLDVLAAINLIKKENDKYSITSLSRDYLLTNSGVNQLEAISQFSGSAGPFDKLTQTLKREAIDFNQKMWSSKEAIMEMEQRAKAGSLQTVISFMKEIPEFASAIKMCDFAGSAGYYSLALMAENSQLHSHVYDLPDVCKIAKELKKEEQNFNHITYHSFDVKAEDTFGRDYDIFFISHFLYELGANNSLSGFLKKVNNSMTMGGLFISNHLSPNVSGESYLTLTIVNLMTRAMGYPTHELSEEILTKALTEAGFGNFRIQQPNEDIAFPTMLLSAVKIKEISANI